MRPYLPQELEYEIFALAARSYKPCQCRLSLVCRRIHDWIFPIMFESVALGFDASKDEELASRLLSFPPCFLSSNIKSVLWHGEAFGNLSLAFFRRLELLQDLHSHKSLSDVISAVPSLPLRRLVLQPLDVETFFPAIKDGTASICSTLTHLDCGLFSQLSEDVFLLRSLTHLAVRVSGTLSQLHSGSTQQVHIISDWLSREQSEVLLMKHYQFMEKLRPIHVPAFLSRIGFPYFPASPRLVVLFCSDVRDFWTPRLLGEPDAWDRADEIVRQRKSGDAAQNVSSKVPD